MTSIHTRLAVALIAALAAGQTLAWGSANRAGGLAARRIAAKEASPKAAMGSC